MCHVPRTEIKPGSLRVSSDEKETLSMHERLLLVTVQIYFDFYWQYAEHRSFSNHTNPGSTPLFLCPSISRSVRGEFFWSPCSSCISTLPTDTLKVCFAGRTKINPISWRQFFRHRRNWRYDTCGLRTLNPRFCLCLLYFGIVLIIDPCYAIYFWPRCGRGKLGNEPEVGERELCCLFITMLSLADLLPDNARRDP